jgi:hypothetical protein
VTARLDRAVAVGLLAGVVVQQLALPHTLGQSDEALFLYESSRLLHGQALYRDVFEIITPGAYWAMALLFRLFGPTLDTARTASAVVSALIAVLVYAICRRLAVRPGLALAAALVGPTLFAPAWPYASPHWVSTLLALLALGVLVRPERGPCDAALVGVLAGLMVAVQQQRGVIVGAGAFLVIVVDAALGRGGAVRAAGAFVAGALAVVVPVAAFMLASAGVWPVFRALVVHALTNYRTVNRIAWGGTLPLLRELATHTWPRLLAWLPAVLVASAARAVASRDADRRRRLARLVGFGAACVGSIAYYPDFVHLAFIGPVLVIALAENVEWTLGLVPAAAGRTAGVAVAGLVVATGALRLEREGAARRAEYPIRYLSPFGRVDLRRPEMAALADRVRGLLDGTGSRELFCYPGNASLYLLTGAVNPTPYQLVMPGYSFPDQLADVVATLDARRTPYVALVVLVDRRDPVVAYLTARYEPLPDQSVERTGVVLMKRKTA